MVNIEEEAKKIIDDIKSGDWIKFIELQTNPYREYCHEEILKYVLLVLSKQESGVFSANSIKGETVYLVSLIRYLGKKPLNNGYYFRKEKDAENFVKQYKKTLASNPFLEREGGEKIEIVGMTLLEKEDVI